MRPGDDESPRFTLELHEGGHLILIGRRTPGPGGWDSATTVSTRHLDLVRRAIGTTRPDQVLLETLAEIIGDDEGAEARFREWLDAHGVPFRRYPDWRHPPLGRRVDP